MALFWEKFVGVALNAPDTAAWRSGDQTVSYGQIAEHVLRVESLLGPSARDRPVAVCSTRTSSWVAAMLAILKQGGVYFPLDPDLPHQRLRAIVDWVRPACILADATGAARLAEIGVEGMTDLPDPPRSAASPQRTALRISDMARARYLLFTSGTTGEPKGVEVPFSLVDRLCAWQFETVGTGSGSTGQLAPIGFDVSLQEVVGGLWNGGHLAFLSNEERRDPDALVERLGRLNVRTLFLPTPLLEHVARAGLRRMTRPPAHVVVAGDRLVISEPIRKWFSTSSDSRLHNHYGPTETHVATAHTLSPPASSWPTFPPIGWPLPHLQAVLIANGRPSASSGELFLVSDGLTTRYWDLPDLTAQKFLHDVTPEGIAYATGDLCRLTRDAGLEFEGRVDRQLKIDGLRIEPAEIEHRIREIEYIADVAVVGASSDSGDVRLGAAVVLETDVAAPPTENSLLTSVRAFLSLHFPPGALPSRVVTLPGLPKFLNGKIDYGAIERLISVDRRQDVRQERKTDAVLHLISEIRPGQSLEAGDDFFRAGMTSADLIRLRSRIDERLGVYLPLQDIFNNPNAEQLSRRIEEARTASAIEEARQKPRRIIHRRPGATSHE